MSAAAKEKDASGGGGRAPHNGQNYLCSKCRSLLQKSPPGDPFYQCGRCSTPFQAKHGIQHKIGGASKRRMSDQQHARSLSDSSSGVILSDRVEVEVQFTGKGDESPLYKRGNVLKLSGGTVESQSSTKMVSEKGSYVTDTWTVTNEPQGELNERVVDPYLPSLKNQQMDKKQLALDTVSDGDLRRRGAQQEIGSIERWSSSLGGSSFGNSVFQVPRSQVRNRAEDTSDALGDMMSNVGGENGSESLKFQSRVNGALGVLKMQKPQTSHLQLARSGLSWESVRGSGDHDHLYRGGQRNGASNANNIQKAPIEAGNMASEASRPKLRWQAREPDSPDEAPAPGAASSKGIGVDDDQISQGGANKFSGGAQDAASMEFVVERNLSTVVSRRRSFSEDRRPGDERGLAGQQLVRSPSEDSDQISDMYDNPASVGDYEPSETSSTTVDEVENNDGSVAGRLSSEMGRFSPPPDQGITRSASRPNLPRSNTSSSRSALSEESILYSPQTDMVSPDTHLDRRKMTAARRHSWDERVSRIGGAAPGNSGPQRGPVSMRQKSMSQDYGSGPAGLLNRVTSDSGGSFGGDPLQAKRTTSYDSCRSLPSALRPYSQQNYQYQPWVNRYAPPALNTQRSQALQQWSPNSSSRSYFAEPSPLHLLQSRPFYSSRQMSGQLPPKQGHYPPLPSSGALPHVLCQHCGVVLAVPFNLPPPKKNTQKLRCGSCRKISIFAVQHAEDSSAGPPPSSNDSPQGQSLLASSPDSQTDFPPACRTAAKSVDVREHRFSVSDLGRRQIHTPLPRKYSLGDEDLTASDQEMADRVLSGRTEYLTIDSYPTPGSSVQTSPSLTSEAIVTSNFSDAPSSDSSTEFNHSSESKTILAGGVPVSSGLGSVSQSWEGLDPMFSKNGQGTSARGNVASEEKHSQEVILTSSDSESDLKQLPLPADSSPQLNQNSTTSPYQNSPTPHDLRSTGRAPEHVATEQVHEARSLNRALKGIFGSRKSKQPTGGGHYRRKVVVNNVPIPDHLIRKAEEQAGPIHPGTYWYDTQAGFWGVAGGQCLGIIPSFIEEFNYPMARDCAAGRTGIFVNGRELHHMDREKLSRRGLPDRPGMSYRIEINGRVVDEANGSELKGLGRLAPSLELKGRGTGMWVPSNVAGGGRS